MLERVYGPQRIRALDEVMAGTGEPRIPNWVRGTSRSLVRAIPDFAGALRSLGNNCHTRGIWSIGEHAGVLAAPSEWHGALSLIAGLPERGCGHEDCLPFDVPGGWYISAVGLHSGRAVATEGAERLLGCIFYLRSRPGQVGAVKILPTGVTKQVWHAETSSDELVEVAQMETPPKGSWHPGRVLNGGLATFNSHRPALVKHLAEHFASEQ